jgi:glutathione S-transferase
VKLVDAARCPYCARVRIALAEKGLEFETVEVDLSDRPQWLRELNPPNGRVPVLDDGFTLPESDVIMAYLEERYPEPPLLPGDPADRALARLLVHRFDERLGDDYYAFRRGDPNDLAARLVELEVGQSLYADITYVPWVIRARDMLGVELPARITAWLGELEQRPAIAAEIALVRSLSAVSRSGT